jgi:hypothetical protein
MPDWGAWPFRAEDPYPAYRAYRKRAPVQWDERVHAHLVLAHDPAEAVLRSPAWSSDPRNNPELLAGFGGPGPVADLWARSLLLSDPPVHARLRSAVNRFFTPRAMEQIRDRIAATVDAALAPLAGGVPVELMSELAYPIPLAVICELLDVGVEGAELLRAETPTLARFLELDPTPGLLEEIGTAAMTVMLFLVPLVAERRQRPGDDLISAMLHPPHGEPLETDEIITMCLLLLGAGHETTANLIGNGVDALLRHPDQLRWLAADPARADGAVEELLRYDPPAQVVPRVATADVALGSVRVRAGELTLLLIGAAGRDPARHAAPETLDLARPARAGHLAFGHGTHFCVGAGLARLEARTVFSRLPSVIAGWDPDQVWVERDGSRTFRRVLALHAGLAKASA